VAPVGERVTLVTRNKRVDIAASNLVEAVAALGLVRSEVGPNPTTAEKDTLDRVFTHYETSFSAFTQVAKNDISGGSKPPYIVMAAGCILLLVIMLGIAASGRAAE
jgi:hypothetical protein